MACCQCQGIETQFDQKHVSKQLSSYRKEGPGKATRILLDALRTQGIKNLSLLNIGGGIGVISHELLQYGIDSAIEVEASIAYINAAKDEAERRGHSSRMNFHYGNFIDLASSLPPADVVTLDKVICCYDDMEALVGLSSAQSHKLYGLVYPRDTWWVRVINAVKNFFFWLKRTPFRLFIHPSRAVDTLVRGKGLNPVFYARIGMWHVAVYARTESHSH